MRVIALSTDVIASSDDIRNQVLAKKATDDIPQRDVIRKIGSKRLVKETDVIPSKD